MRGRWEASARGGGMGRRASAASWDGEGSLLTICGIDEVNFPPARPPLLVVSDLGGRGRVGERVEAEREGCWDIYSIKQKQGRFLYVAAVKRPLWLRVLCSRGGGTRDLDRMRLLEARLVCDHWSHGTASFWMSSHAALCDVEEYCTGHGQPVSFVCVHIAATMAFLLSIRLYDGFPDTVHRVRALSAWTQLRHSVLRPGKTFDRLYYAARIICRSGVPAHRIAQQPVLMLPPVIPCVTWSHEILTAVTMLFLWHLHRVSVQRCSGI